MPITTAVAHSGSDVEDEPSDRHDDTERDDLQLLALDTDRTAQAPHDTEHVLYQASASVTASGGRPSATWAAAIFARRPGARQ
jgi:hypothetical protein